MAEQFYTILTKIGKAKIANASALGAKVNFSKFQVGDSNGSYYNPTEDQTQLKHKVWEGNINSISVDENNPNWIVIEILLPSNIGGFMIREAAILDDENNMIAVAKYPETYKPITSEGSSKDLLIRTILEVSNASSVTIKVDPTVILATKKDIEILENKIKNIKVPVTSINGKTGDVELKAEDVKTASGATVESMLSEKAKESDAYRLTKNKTVTGAINELFTSVSDDTKSITKINSQLGDITRVPTTSKTVTGAISELFTSASDGKNLVANAVTNKGVVASSSDTFSSLATKIGSIRTGKKFAQSRDIFSYEPFIPDLDVSSLDFRPHYVIIEHQRYKSSRNFRKSYIYIVGGVDDGVNGYPFQTSVCCVLGYLNGVWEMGSGGRIRINDNGFRITLDTRSPLEYEVEDLVTWVAME